MTDLGELRDQLEQLSTRGAIRPSAEVLDAARRSIDAPSRSRLRLVVPIAAAVVLLASVAGWYVVSNDDPVSITTGSEPALIDSLTVPVDGLVRQVTVAFGRIWVASMHDGWPPSTTIRVFDAATGEPVGRVETPGPTSPDLVGDALPMVASDHALWVRTTTAGPAIPEYGGADNLIYRVEPETLAAEPVRFLQGDGPLVAYRDRIVAADFSHLEIVDDDGRELANRTVDEVMGIDGATVPGTNGIGRLHLDANGLWAVHEGRQLVVRLDPDTGELLAVGELGDEGGGPPAGRSIWWATTLNFSVAVGIALDDPGARVVHADLPLGLNLIDSIDNDRFLVDNPAAVIGAASGRVATLDPDAEMASVVSDGGRMRVAVWSSGEGDTVVRFLPIPHP